MNSHSSVPYPLNICRVGEGGVDFRILADAGFSFQSAGARKRGDGHPPGGVWGRGEKEE